VFGSQSNVIIEGDKLTSGFYESHEGSGVAAANLSAHTVIPLLAKVNTSFLRI
jgi:hypothetical protein